MKLYFDDENFDGQLQRSVGKCDSGMANVGECLYIASQITPGDRNSWYQLWSAFADKLVQQADTALAAGHTVSARGCYLRAAEYYRQAFLLAPRQPRCSGAPDRLLRERSGLSQRASAAGPARHR